MSRQRVAGALVAVLLLGLLLWGARRGQGEPPPPSSGSEGSSGDPGGATEPTWSLAELPSVGPSGGGPPAPESTPAAPAAPSAPAAPEVVPAAAEPGPAAGRPATERRPPPSRGLPGALGEEAGQDPGASPAAGSPLWSRLRAAGSTPPRIYQALDGASPAELHAYLEDAQTRARPELRPFLAVPSDAPREQLLHTALLNEAIRRREAAVARHGERIPVGEAAILAELNLAVAERGLNSAEAQGAIDADLARALQARPGAEGLDRLFAAAQAELDRVTGPGPPPEDPLALALKQASAYYRVMALAALRLERGTGRRVPSLTPELSAGSPAEERGSGREGGMSGALEGR